MSNGLSWEAIGVLGGLATAVLTAVVSFGLSITSRLSAINVTLQGLGERLEKDSQQHGTMQATLQEHGERLADHEVRIARAER